MTFEDVSFLDDTNWRIRVEPWLEAQAGVLKVEIEDRRVVVTFRANCSDHDPQDVAMLMLAAEKAGGLPIRPDPIYGGQAKPPRMRAASRRSSAVMPLAYLPPPRV